MNRDDCFFLGFIKRTHGTKGELLIKLDVSDPARYQQLESVFIEIDDKLVPFFIDVFNLQSNKEAIVKLQDVDTMDRAGELVGKQLFLPLDLLPPLSGKKFYFHEVTGFGLTDIGLGSIGTITGVLELPGQPKLRVDYKGREVLVPIADELIVEVDRERKVIVMNVPEGLLEF